MGQDNQPKHRQLIRELKRTASKRKPVDRLLIVCEGSKTEPEYINEIRKEMRLSTANIQALPSALGTEPIQVVEYARQLFTRGDRDLQIKERAFDKIFAVFDRDDHKTYHEALAEAESINNTLTNDEGKKVSFEAIASVPCFEIWLLLHYEDVQIPIHRNEVYAKLRSYLPEYEKGQGGHWGATSHNSGIASYNAIQRSIVTTAINGIETFTDMHRLLEALNRLKI